MNLREFSPVGDDLVYQNVLQLDEESWKSFTYMHNIIVAPEDPAGWVGLE